MENPIKGIIDEQIIEKWLPVIEGTGEWEIIKDYAPKVYGKQYGMVAQLLENTANMITEDTNSSNVGTYNKILIPMIRRVAPALIANEILGVQPLTGPTGLVFMLKAFYSGTETTSVQRATSVILTLADASTFTEDGDITGSASGVGKVRYIEGNNILVAVTSGTFTVGDDVDNAATYAASKTTISASYDNESYVNMIFQNYTGNFTTTESEALGTDMREIGFDIISKSVELINDKLKARWTLEVEDDLKALHNLSAEMVLSDVASEEIINEMNRRFINKIDTLATQGGVGTWDYSAADGRWEIEKYQNMIAQISRTRKQIAKSSKRGQANFAIVSSDVASALESSGKLRDLSNNTYKDFGNDPYQNTVAGTLNGIKVFVDLFTTENHIILGYKGANEIDAGLFYSPYIPLKIEKGMAQESGQPRLYFRTRYALTENPAQGKNYYRKIIVSNLPHTA